MRVKPSAIATNRTVGDLLDDQDVLITTLVAIIELSVCGRMDIDVRDVRGISITHRANKARAVILSLLKIFLPSYSATELAKIYGLSRSSCQRAVSMGVDIRDEDIRIDTLAADLERVVYDRLSALAAA